LEIAGLAVFDWRLLVDKDDDGTGFFYSGTQKEKHS
jgi:hypothetical protein